MNRFPSIFLLIAATTLFLAGCDDSDKTPSAELDADCTGLTCFFDGSQSSIGDDGTITGIRWYITNENRLPDNAEPVADVSSFRHLFDSPDDYLVVLEVESDAGRVDRATTIVQAHAESVTDEIKMVAAMAIEVLRHAQAGLIDSMAVVRESVTHAENFGPTMGSSYSVDCRNEGVTIIRHWADAEETEQVSAGDLFESEFEMCANSVANYPVTGRAELSLEAAEGGDEEDATPNVPMTVEMDRMSSDRWDNLGMDAMLLTESAAIGDDSRVMSNPGGQLALSFLGNDRSRYGTTEFNATLNIRALSNETRWVGSSLSRSGGGGSQILPASIEGIDVDGVFQGPGIQALSNGTFSIDRGSNGRLIFSVDTDPAYLDVESIPGDPDDPVARRRLLQTEVFDQ